MSSQQSLRLVEKDVAILIEKLVQDNSRKRLRVLNQPTR
jgi:hypothetical protein